MGTVLSLELGAVDQDEASRIFGECWAEADRLEKIFSRYDPESELSRINRTAAGGPVEISEEMLEVLSRAIGLSRLTGGAFDVTVGPLLAAWGMFPRREGRVPDRREIAAVLSRTGWEKIDLNRKNRTVRFLSPGLEIDLGGLAKGYAVDRLAALLAAQGVKSALVNAGGDIYCLGEHPEKRGWRIGVEHPREEGEVLAVLELEDRAVATSGDYRNYFIRLDRRYSHIIDPRTGEPAQTGVMEVTVLAPDCLTADGLATALFVLGPERGLELLDTGRDWEGLVIAGENGELVIHRSAGFPVKEER
ncbi:MAG: FAD:protein FMN transferase [Candidatus Erginobacter occultus]|nr:FAD:protein FMN transferase [Candidatus Erginobacter occultus]